MWVESVTELDKPIFIMGFEVEDFAVGSCVLVMCNFIFETFLPVLAVSTAVMYFVKRIKKGKPPGFIVHLAHSLDLIRIPGVLSAHRHEFSPVSAEHDG